MSTITLTLELPDDLAERLVAMDPERRRRFAVALLEREREEDESGLPPIRLSAEGAAAVNAALAAAEAGAERVFDFDAERRRAQELIQRAAS